MLSALFKQHGTRYNSYCILPENYQKWIPERKINVQYIVKTTQHIELCIVQNEAGNTCCTSC